MAAAEANRAGDGGIGARGFRDMVFEPLPLLRSERRLAVRAYHYWTERLGGRALPMLADCADLDSQPFADHAVLLDLTGERRASRVRYLGATLSRDDQNVALVSELLQRLPAIAAVLEPVGCEADLAEGDGAVALFSYRGILLPLADAAGRPAHILGVVTSRIEHDEVLDDDIFDAVGSIIGAEPVLAPSPWGAAPSELPADADAGQLLGMARTWAAMARADLARSDQHSHAALSAVHDAARDLDQEALSDMVESVFGHGGTAPLHIAAILRARRLGIGPRRLAALLDAQPGGVEGFLAASARGQSAWAERETIAPSMRLSRIVSQADPAAVRFAR